jgi:hypothetical protein
LVELEERGSAGIWGIGQVLQENFYWLPFNPLWSPSRSFKVAYLGPVISKEGTVMDLEKVHAVLD